MSRVYGFGDCGCKYETMTKEEIKEMAVYKEVIKESGLTGINVFKIQPYTPYLIVRKIDTSINKWNFSVHFRYYETHKTTGAKVSKSIVLNTPAYSTDKAYVDKLRFKLVEITQDNSSITVKVLWNDDNTTTTTIGLSNLDYRLELLNENYLEVNNANKVYVENIEGAAVIDCEHLFIRYAEDINGSNMSSVWDATKTYIGIYTGKVASEKAADYQWVNFNGGNYETFAVNFTGSSVSGSKRNLSTSEATRLFGWLRNRIDKIEKVNTINILSGVSYITNSKGISVYYVEQDSEQALANGDAAYRIIVDIPTSTGTPVQLCADFVESGIVAYLDGPNATSYTDITLYAR
jgi:hypothetical protein